ncbi:hypothetical protein PMAYCL1PPCAC_11302, partial [Pristionchus mayeri]
CQLHKSIHVHEIERSAKNLHELHCSRIGRAHQQPLIHSHRYPNFVFHFHSTSNPAILMKEREISEILATFADSRHRDSHSFPHSDVDR